MRRAARTGRLLTVVLFAVLLCLAGSTGADPSPVSTIRAGDSLADVLRDLQEAGVPVVFSDTLVRPDLRVLETPSAREPRAILEEILEPHGLGTRDGPGGRILVVSAEPSPDRSAEDPATSEPPVLIPMTVTGESIEVIDSRPWVLGETPSVLKLERDDLLALPHVGDDVFRSLALLPGTNTNDASARLSIRGGREDELLIRVDGVEIIEPYHLRDFGSAMGILAPQIVETVELMTGGFSAEHGDRMSGVLELETVRPSWRRRSELGLNLFGVQAATSGRRGDGELSWLVSGRGGSLELPARIAEEEERPVFGDSFFKLDRQVTAQRSFIGSLLVSVDRLRFAELDEEGEALERFDTGYRNAYAWLTHQEIRSPSLFFETRLTATRLGQDRLGFESDPDAAPYELEDRRRTVYLTGRQDWTWQVDDTRRLSWGADLRRLDVDYDYRNDRAAGEVPPLVPETDPSRTTTFDRRFTGEQIGLWASGHWQPHERFSMELGLRFDRNTVLDEDHLASPRLSLRYTASPRHLWHAAAGRYTQSQRLYELQVEDGVVEFTPSERAEYWSFGYEHVFRSSPRARRPLTLRAEVYQRRVDGPRARFENLFEPISKVPEIELDRVRIAPLRSLSQGFELFLGGAAGQRIDWFATYTLSRSEDRLDDGSGVRDVPRQQDQPHALRLDVAWHAPRGWELHFAWYGHTGWPTTELSARRSQDAGSPSRIEPVLGPLRAERLPDYARLDLRLARTWDLARGELYAYLEVQNVLNRRNVRGYDIAYEPREDGSVQVVLDANSWGGTFPSFGVRWRF